jgi:MFS family permease
LSADLEASTTLIEPAPGRWGPFSNAAFAAIWAASLVMNIGNAVFDTSSAWLMTSLNASPMAVSLVQVAASLPVFLLTLPAGALADIIDARRFLIAAEIAALAVIAVFAATVSLGFATPATLLLTTFLLSAFISLTGPAWLSITALLVNRAELDGAIAANGVGYNISRAVGPALAGLVIASIGISAPFWIDAAGCIVMTATLLWWRSARRSVETLPAERLTSAVRTGVRYAANNPHLRATLIRAVAFAPFASAYWALLPLVARHQMVQGPELYGVMVAALGLGATGGSFALTWLKAEIGPDRLVALGTLVTAIALVLFGLSRQPVVALAACLIAGAAWTVVVTSLYVSAQVALPDWVRGRGLAILLAVIFGGMTIGSAAWGRIAGIEGLTVAHFLAAAGIMVAIPLTWRWKLQTAAGIDLSPSMHWRAPVVAKRIDNNQGPVLVTVEYRLDATNRAAFLAALDELGRERKRDGAFAWGVFEDVADTGRFVETFLIESWLELMYQHERVTNADRVHEDQIRRLLSGSPKVTHLIASRRRRRPGAHFQELLAAPFHPPPRPPESS